MALMSHLTDTCHLSPYQQTVNSLHSTYNKNSLELNMNEAVLQCLKEAQIKEILLLAISTADLHHLTAIAKAPANGNASFLRSKTFRWT